MKKTLFFLWVILLVGVTSSGFISCTSNEPSPEQVDDSFNDEIYFVSGRVTSGQSSLSGVSVKIDNDTPETMTSADGTYQLFLSKKGNYVLRFHKDGYVDIVTTILFSDNTPNRSSIVVSPDMTLSSAAVTVTPDSEIDIADPTGRAVLSVMSSFAEKTDVSLTVYKELPVNYALGNSLKSEPYGVGYTTVEISPVGIRLTKESTLRVNKQTSDAISFASVDLYQRNTNNEWVKANDVTLDKSRNAYTASITELSSYSMRIPYTVSGGQETVSDHLNGSLDVDNCGNMAARENIEIKVSQLCGWDFVTDLHKEVRSTFSGISQSDEDALCSKITEQITSLEGSFAGFYELPVTLSTASVSGNSVMHYENYAKERILTYSFDIVYQNTPYTIAVMIKKYTGMDERYTNKSCYQHSGGQGQ